MDNLVQGNTKTAMRDAGATSSDLWNVPVDNITILEGFNVRVRNEAYAERVEWIKNSILANGYYRDKPLTGYVAKIDGEDKIVLIGGHRRLEAVHSAIAEGAEITTVPVIVKVKGTGVEDITVDLMVGNEGTPLTVYESALVCKRLAGYGMESDTIATRLGYKSAQYVDNLLLLASAPPAIRDAVTSDKLAATEAIKLLIKHGDKAIDVLTKLGASSGSKKVTAKAIDPRAKAIKRKAVELYYLAHEVLKCKLPEPLRESLQKILDDIENGS